MTRKIPSSGFGRAKKSAGKKTPAKTAKKSATVETVVTYLEMRENHHHHVHPPSNFKLALIHAENPTVHFYRYLYETIGATYNWVDRKYLGDDDLARLINKETVDIFVAYADGTPAGFYEIGKRSDTETWIDYFGIIPDFIGKGLGKWLLAEAVASAWDNRPEVVRVETCSLDHPRALPLYQRMGFTPYLRQDKTMPLDQAD